MGIHALLIKSPVLPSALPTENEPASLARRPEVTVLMPCLDEVLTLGACIESARRALLENSILGEILVADNGSNDGSIEVAQRLGARVVGIPLRGYGSALCGGISVALGEYIIMADADESYDFAYIPQFLERLRQGDDVVIGNRFLGGILPGAMPPLHRYLGNPILTGIGRFLFGAACGDFHCGMRGFRTESIRALRLATPGMEFATEMIVKATMSRLRVSEIPTTLAPDGRNRRSHLRSFRDGWRHLKFMLQYRIMWFFQSPPDPPSATRSIMTPPGPTTMRAGDDGDQ